MPIELSFHEDGHIIEYRLTEPLDISELSALFETDTQHRDSVDFTVHSITDCSQLRSLPRNWLGAKSGPGLHHPRSGEIVIVGVTPGLKVLVDTMMKIARFKRVKLVNTLNEARTYLHDVVTQEHANPPVE